MHNLTAMMGSVYFAARPFSLVLLWAQKSPHWGGPGATQFHLRRSIDFFVCSKASEYGYLSIHLECDLPGLI